jgi:hypothetical protein
MVSATQADIEYPDDPTKTITGSVGCTGSCNYKWNGQRYIWVSGSCTGTGNCPPCPAFFPSAVYDLVRELPTLFPDPNAIGVQCAVSSASSVTVPLLILYSQAIQNQQEQTVLKQKNNRYRNLSIGLGIMSLLLLASLVYALFFR